MPELPEVETMVRGIRPHLQDCTIVAVRKCRCRKKPLFIEPAMRQISKRTCGAVINKVYRLAKRIVMELSTGDSFVIEPRMTGLMLVEDIPTQEHLRVEWSVVSPDAANDQEASRVWFWDRRGLGTVRLFSPTEFTANLGAHKLGPDALQMTAANWESLCSQTKRAIKVALLDQKLVAGIGNLYASEILHLANISPLLPANELKQSDRRRLAKATNSILNEAIRYEGSTLSDGTYRNALNKSGGYQNAHRVYDRAGEVCKGCQTEPVVRIVQNQRSTFFCPRCQP